MTALPRDVVYLIAQHTDTISLARLSMISKRYNSMLKDQPEILKWKQYSDRESMNNCVIQALKEGNEAVARLMADKCKGLVDWHRALRAACIAGSTRLIDWTISHGANDWDKGAQGACLGRHRDILERMLTLTVNGGRNHSKMYYAAMGGFEDLVLTIINSSLVLRPMSVYEDGLLGACRGGHRGLVELFTTLGAHDPHQRCFLEALQGGHYKIALSLPLSNYSDVKGAIHCAYAGGNKDCINLVRNIYGKLPVYEVPYACNFGHRDIISELIVDPNVSFSLDWALRCAVAGGHKDIMRELIARGANDWAGASRYANLHSHYDLFTELTTRQQLEEQQKTSYKWRQWFKGLFTWRKTESSAK